MTKEQHNNILILGGPNVGKTHFGGQLYGRLTNRMGHYKIISPPENLSFFKEVLENLEQGKSASRTHVSSNEQLEIEVEDTDGKRIVFSFPDYGGEQINEIVNYRKVNDTWTENIYNSTAWLLFIRLDEIKPIEDLINRGLPEEDVLKSRNESVVDLSLSAEAFYIELLQMLLYIKNISTLDKVNHLKLTVVLSCWDRIDDVTEKTKPSNLLHKRLPILKNYIDSTWGTDSISYVGLSSTERTLSNKDEDEEFLDKGPENIGYVIDPKGTKNQDLTLLIKEVL